MGDEINPQARSFRRRAKRFQGATWTPNNMSAVPGDGAWCAKCRQRHGYKSNALRMGLEKASNGRWRILWTCKKTGDVVEMMELNKVRPEEE
jgi:hypothetical protein